MIAQFDSIICEDLSKYKQSELIIKLKLGEALLQYIIFSQDELENLRILVCFFNVSRFIFSEINMKKIINLLSIRWEIQKKSERLNFILRNKNVILVKIV